jgi:1-phosphofructokinase
VIATVTLNPAVDKTMSIPGFAIGRTNRATIEQVDAGGKGINVAKALQQFGCPVTALGFLAGNNGRTIAAALDAAAIPGDFVWLPGETRVNLKIKDPLSATETEVNESGPSGDACAIEALGRKIDEAAARCDLVVFSGSLPPGVPPGIYADFIRTAKRRGARTILDTAGPALKLGLAAAPNIIKPNLAEAEEVLGVSLDDDARLAAAGRSLLALGPNTVVISMGPRGAFAASHAGMWRAFAPAVPRASTIGAGDAMVAALALSAVRKAPLPDALRLAVAAAAATVQTNGSAADLRTVEQLSPLVLVEGVQSGPAV